MSKKKSSSSDRSLRFPHLEFLFSLKPTRMKLGLENVSRLLDYLGSPEKRFPAILVAGTNGKGSTTAFLSSILQSLGLRVGAFYSPHLIRMNERIRVNNQEIPTYDLDRIIGSFRKFYPSAKFTFFEGLVAASVLYFVEKDVDIAVFEVGLGGRLDATKLVNAVLTVITGIAIDHTEHLGKTREGILREKLGIVREGVPLVANLTTVKLLQKAKRYCIEHGVEIFDVRGSVRAILKSMDFQRMLFDLETPNHSYRELSSRMIGRHQLWNISTAVLAIEVLSKNLPHSMSDKCSRWSLFERLESRFFERGIREGINSAFVPGRFQVLDGSPVLIVDVSHNENGLLSALDTFKGLSARENSIIIFGIQANKDPGRFFKEAHRVASRIIVVPLKTKRSASVGDLVRRFREASRSVRSPAEIIALRGTGEALKFVNRICKSSDTVLILGSHFLIEEAVRYI